MFWTESSIRKVAAEVASDVVSGSKGAESARKHVSALLRGTVVAEVGTELQSTAETLAEGAKVSLNRKLNAIYAAHSEKLKRKLEQLEQELEDREPKQKKRLEQLEQGLAELEAACGGWLEVPKQELERAAVEHQQAFSNEMNRLAKNAEARVKGIITRVEKQLSDLVQENLRDLLLDTIREHVASTPYEPDGLSNRQIAATRRISLRQVKRLRRLGLA